MSWFKFSLDLFFFLAQCVGGRRKEAHPNSKSVKGMGGVVAKMGLCL